MMLKFPHVRLFMRNMLAEGTTLPETIANTAYEYGLITKEGAERVRSTTASGGCACMAAARQVLVENISCSAKAEKLKPQIDNIWSTVESRTQKGASKDANSTQDGKGHHCELAAPAVFDVLLQEISRY